MHWLPLVYWSKRKWTFIFVIDVFWHFHAAVLVQKGRQAISKSKKISNFFLIKTKASSVYDVCLFVFVQSLLNTHCFLHLRLSLISRRYNFDEHVDSLTCYQIYFCFCSIDIDFVFLSFHVLYVWFCLFYYYYSLKFGKVTRKRFFSNIVITSRLQ